MRIVWVVDALYRNGAVLLSLELARRLRHLGSRLVVLGRLGPQQEVPVPQDLDWVALTRSSRRLHRYAGPAVVRLAGIARQGDVVVNCSEIGGGLLVSALAARLSRRPLVVAVHADLDDAVEEWVAPRLRRLYYWLHRNVDGAICVEPALAAPLVRNGLDPARIRVVRNGIDITAVRRRALADVPAEITASPWAQRATPGLPVVVATGRIAAQKAYDVLVRAHADVVVEVPHVLHIHNDGPDREAVDALIAELGVGDSVLFQNPATDPLPAVARAAAFVLPSRHEGLPLSLLEAVALGVPCIATDSSDGVRAVLDGGRVGRLVPVGDLDALSRALREHLTDPRPLQAMAALGPAHAEGFDIEVTTRAWGEALGELVVRRAR